MKKLTMILAVVLVAGMTQAAAVVWNSGAVKGPNADGSFGANIKGTTGQYIASVFFFSDAAGTIAVDGVTGTTYGTSSFASAFVNTTSDSFAVTTDFWAQMVITSTPDSGGKYYKMTSSLLAFTTPATANANLNFTSALPQAWTVVPEPTSMALLALGIAALGLRRKRS